MKAHHQSKSLLNLISVSPSYTQRTSRMKMGSVTVSFASILANDCRSLSSPVTLVRTLATTLVALSKHHNKHLVAWSSGCSTSNTTAFACEYSKPDVTHTATTTSVNGYVKVYIFIGWIEFCLFGCWENWGNHRNVKFLVFVISWISFLLNPKGVTQWAWDHKVEVTGSKFQSHSFKRRKKSHLLLMGNSDFQCLLLIVCWVSVSLFIT